MQDSGGLLPLLALDPGRDEHGPASRFVTTDGSKWDPAVSPLDNEEAASEGDDRRYSEAWKELMEDEDPIHYKRLGHNVKTDPPLIVSEGNYVMLKSSYDDLYWRGMFTNPVDPSKDLYGVPGGDEEDTPALKIVFDDKGRLMLDEHGLIVTVPYTPEPRDESEKHGVLRGQVWLWYDSTRVASIPDHTLLKLAIANYITKLAPVKTQRYDFTDVDENMTVTVSDPMEGTKHKPDGIYRWRSVSTQYVRVSFEWRTDPKTAKDAADWANTISGGMIQWTELNWAYRWAKILSVDSEHIVKGVMIDEWLRWWELRQLYANEELPRAAERDALPEMADGPRRYW